MSRLKGFRARLRAIVRDQQSDGELRDEIAFHLERETEKNRRLGMSPAEARRVAVAHFGGVERVREEHRDVRRVSWFEDFVGDARFALRSLRRTPALAGAAIVTLAVGIGANVAIFSAVNAVVLQPLPFPNQNRLVMLSEDNPEKNWHQQVAAPANYLDWRARVTAFADAAAYASYGSEPTLIGRGEPRRQHGRSHRQLVLDARRSSDAGPRADRRRNLGKWAPRGGAQLSWMARSLRRRLIDRRSIAQAERARRANRRRDGGRARVPDGRRRSLDAAELDQDAAGRRFLPARSLSARHRASQTRRQCHPGRRAVPGRRSTAPARVSGNESGDGRGHGAAPRLPRRGHEAAAAGPARRRRTAAAHRVCQCRQSSSRAGSGRERESAVRLALGAEAAGSFANRSPKVWCCR